MSELSDALNKLRSKGKLNICEAAVIKVDKNKKLVDVQTLVGKADVPDVRLKAAINENQNYQVLYPKKKSIVWIAFADNTSEAVVIAYSEIDSMECKCDDIVFNDGLNKGLVNVTPLIREISKIDANTTLLRTLITASFVAQDSVLAGIGSAANAVFGAGSSAIQAAVTTDFEDTKIKH